MLKTYCRSSALLRRMAQKGHITKPDILAALPSARKWGGKSGSCYVESEKSEFVMDGIAYEVVKLGSKKYVFKTRLL